MTRNAMQQTSSKVNPNLPFTLPLTLPLTLTHVTDGADKNPWVLFGYSQAARIHTVGIFNRKLVLRLELGFDRTNQPN